MKVINIFFAKMFDGKDGLLFIFDFTSNNIITSFENTAKGQITIEYDYKFIKIKDDE